MLLDEFFDPRILIVSGKGGVGKTTVTAALALSAARQGRKVCVAEVNGKGTLARLLGEERVLDYEPSEISPGVWGMNILAEESLAEYLRVQYHMHRISKAFTSTHFVDYITTAAPGLKDILILGKVWYLEQGPSKGGTKHDFDTIILDAPAAGHMLTFLSAPVGLSDALRVGPVRRQAEWLVEMLREPGRTRVHLVTLPEEMPVTETLETAEGLRDRVKVTQGAIFANAVYSELFTSEEEDRLDANDRLRPALVEEARTAGLEIDDQDVNALLDYASFLRARRSIQAAHLRKLRKNSGQPIVEPPFLFSAGLALPDIENLADVIEERVEKL